MKEFSLQTKGISAQMRKGRRFETGVGVAGQVGMWRASKFIVFFEDWLRRSLWSHQVCDYHVQILYKAGTKENAQSTVSYLQWDLEGAAVT